MRCSCYVSRYVEGDVWDKHTGIREVTPCGRRHERQRGREGDPDAVSLLPLFGFEGGGGELDHRYGRHGEGRDTICTHVMLVVLLMLETIACRRCSAHNEIVDGIPVKKTLLVIPTNCAMRAPVGRESPRKDVEVAIAVNH